MKGFHEALFAPPTFDQTGQRGASGRWGSGSRMLENLVCLHRAMIALGYPHGLNFTLIDDDRERGTPSLLPM